MDSDSREDRSALADAVTRLCRLHGIFQLRSGQVSDTYFDKYRFESEPAILAALARHAAKLVPAGSEVLAGLELGGVPFATALSLETGLPAAYVRKEPKPYGTRQLVEGHEVRDRRVLVVEDVITTGGQVVHSVQRLRADCGAHVDTVLCAIDRSAGNHRLLDDIGVGVLSVFSSSELGA